MKLGFIGAGNMGSAIIKGFIESNAVNPADINVIRKNTDALADMAREIGINPYTDYEKLIADSSIVVLAVKPNVFPVLLPSISQYLKGKLIISMAAGVTAKKIEELLGYETPVIRIMPNVNAAIRLSATALCKNAMAKDDELKAAAELFSSIGLAVEVPENQFAIFTAIAGCSPAYVYMFIDALAKGAVKAGMNKQKALEIAAYAVYGSAALVSRSGEHPAKLCDSVCSPGGTTIEGVCTLDECGFTSAVTSAVTNSIKKDFELSKK